MATINVLKSFILNIEGELKQFAAGIHDVADEIAGHWYVQAHSEDAAQALVDAEAKAKAEVDAAEAKAKSDAEAAAEKKGK